MKVFASLRCAPLALLLGLALAAPAQAGDAAVQAALKEHQGKTVTLMLASGAEVTGKVGSVAADSVRLQELTGKEFFDAVIDLDHVQAVVFRARQN